MSNTQHDSAYTVIAHCLALLAMWTLVIKFVFPLVYDYSYGYSVGTHIMWDFWWVAHLILAWHLTHWNALTYRLAMAVCVAEIVIIIAKFYSFFSVPVLGESEWTIWRSSWFVNKVFVLTCFIVLFVMLLRNRESGGGKENETVA